MKQRRQASQNSFSFPPEADRISEILTKESILLFALGITYKGVGWL